MTLRKKTLLIIGATFYGVIILLFFISRNILLESFVTLEQQNARQNVERVQGAFSSELSYLEATTGDWAAWNDTYNFIEDANQSYIESNLIDATFTELRLNLMMYLNSSGQIVFGKAFDLDNETETQVSQSLRRYLVPGDILVTHPDVGSSVSGILLLPEGPMLIASRPILTSEDKGPVRGTLIMGRYLEAAEIKRLSEATRLSITMHQFTDLQAPADFQEARLSLSAEAPIFVRPLSEQSIAGYILISDIYGRPGLVLRVDMPRDIYQQGQATISYLMLSIVGIGLVFGLATVFLLERQVLSRLSRLGNSVSSIGISGDVSARVSMAGTDELANLGATINGMLAALQESGNELRDSESRYRVLAENATDVIWTMNMDISRLTYISPSVTRLLGYSVDEATSKTMEEVLTPASAELAFKAFEEEMAIENTENKDLSRSRTLELEFLRKDSSTVPAEVIYSFLREPDGHPVGILAIARDITERKRARQRIIQAAKEWRTTFDSISDLVSIVDRDFKLLRVNRAYADAVKIEPKELIGRTCYEVFEGAKESCPDCPHMSTMATREVVVNETFNSSLGIYLEILASPVFDDEGQVTASVCVARDITERKHAEEKLQELYREEKDLRRALEAEINRRVEFTRALVHELKTPLTPVLVSSELLLEELKDEFLLDLARNINQSALNLNQRIDELFDLARGEIGMLQLNPEPVDPARLLQGIHNNMTPVAQRNGQSLDLELPPSLPTVWADEDRLRQVVLNLINNALKFTPAGGKIILRAREDRDHLIIEVQDTGCGISKEDQQWIFQPYHQLESERANLGGLGLGLALSKSLVELHGGQIWVESQKNKGSTFSFSIPLEAASQQKEGDETP